MRQEKKFLVEETAQHLAKSNYLYVAGFDRLNVEEVGQLRRALEAERAEYHVVKNSILNLAVAQKDLPPLTEEALKGATAIVVGGENATSVAKILDTFANESGHEGKLTMKCGFLEGRPLSKEDILALSKLPTLAELRAQLLSLLQEPVRRLLRVCNAGAEGFLRLLVAYSKEKN